MTDVEKQGILSSDPFQVFFEHSSKLMERALKNDIYDFTVDYSSSTGNSNINESSSNNGLILENRFYDAKWSKNRTITGLAWNSKVSHFSLFVVLITRHMFM